MQQNRVERIAIVCDRCGLRALRAGEDNCFKRMTSIGFMAQEGSTFGQGQRVEIDLCEPCLRDALGQWLRLRTPDGEELGADLAVALAAFDPERHGGEFPARDREDLDEVFRSLAVADAEDDVAQTSSVQASLDADAWVPIAALFNRLADGATLEQILQAFPAISRRAACDALREAALRFPFHASFHRAVNVWTPRYPYER